MKLIVVEILCSRKRGNLHRVRIMMHVSLSGWPDPNGNPPIAAQNAHLKRNVNLELNFGNSPGFVHG